MRRTAAKGAGLCWVVVGTSLLSLAACGDGGGGSGASPINQPPAFTSGTSVSFAENGTGVVYQAAASDPEGQQVQFAIAGGDDASKFNLTNGELRFNSPPDFDLPGDANGDNVYEVQLSAGDGSLSSTLSLKVTVTNLKEGISVHRVATGFVNPVAISAVSDTVMLVAEADGAIYELNPTTGAKALRLTIAGLASKGLVSMVASSTYNSDGAFFVLYYTQTGFVIVQKYLRNLATWVPFAFGPVLSTPSPQNPGGWLGFQGADLLIGIGDPSSRAQDGSVFGKLTRVAPDPDPFAGASPNFFVLTQLAKGLHQPGGAAPVTNGWLVAERGTTIADEVDLLDNSKIPLNFAWPAKEGNTLVAGATVPAGAVDPLLEIPRKSDGKTGLGIVGGVLGSAANGLNGSYVFADRGGAIYVVDVAKLVNGETKTLAFVQRRDEDFVPDAGLIDHPVAVVASPGNVIYILDDDGEVFRVN